MRRWRFRRGTAEVQLADSFFALTPAQLRTFDALMAKLVDSSNAPTS